jgi:hypothetical protein
MLHNMYIALMLLVMVWIAIWISTGQYDPEWPEGFFFLSGIYALIGVLPTSALFPRGWRDVFRARKGGITGAAPKKKPVDATKAGSDAARTSGSPSKQEPSRPYNARYQSHKKYLQQKR